MITRLAIIASTWLVCPLTAFGDEPALIPISEMTEGTLNDNEILARCSGYYAAYSRYIFNVQDEPGLFTMFTKGAGRRSENLTLEIVGPEAQEATIEDIEAYDAAYFSAFVTAGPDRINDRTDPRNRLANLDGNTCGDVMVKASEQVMGELQ